MSDRFSNEPNFGTVDNCEREPTNRDIYNAVIHLTRRMDRMAEVLLGVARHQRALEKQMADSTTLTLADMQALADAVVSGDTHASELLDALKQEVDQLQTQLNTATNGMVAVSDIQPIFDRIRVAHDALDAKVTADTPPVTSTGGTTGTSGSGTSTGGGDTTAPAAA